MLRLREESCDDIMHCQKLHVSTQEGRGGEGRGGEGRGGEGRGGEGRGVEGEELRGNSPARFVSPLITRLVGNLYA